MIYRLITFAVAAASFAAFAKDARDEAPPKATPNEKRELLAEHRTVSKFGGVQQRTCRGLTALCPNRCGHSGDFASFAVVRYLSYKKPGKYGDPKQESFIFQVADNHGKPKCPKEVADHVGGLKPDDLVLLEWRHDYVTRTEPGGGSASFPERPIVHLEKLTKEQADKLIAEAAKE